MQTKSTFLLAKIICPVLLGLAACSGGASQGAGDPASGEESAAITGTEQNAYAFFVGKGLTSFQAAGIVGNLMQESNVEPGAVQPGGAGRGIAQWSEGGRWNADRDDNVEWYASTHGGSAGSLETQLDFIWYELETYSNYGLSRLRATTNVSEATVVFQTDFEGCGECEQATRIRYAETVLATHGSGSGGTSTDVEGCYSATLRQEMPHNACVQSASNKEWYQCANGVWTDRWTDPAACDGVHPL